MATEINPCPNNRSVAAPWPPAASRQSSHRPVALVRWYSDTVMKALQKVEGVEKTEVNYDKQEAVLTYDDAKTGVEALTKATDVAGYPSKVKK